MIPEVKLALFPVNLRSLFRSGQVKPAKIQARMNGMRILFKIKRRKNTEIASKIVDVLDPSSRNSQNPLILSFFTFGWF
jgi:3-deoxy-D-arabino-heptulosonate 7-phosphate (DAHP) synthase